MDCEEQPNSQKYVEVHIYFPQTCKEPYKMSINDAKQSGYIATQIIYFENDHCCCCYNLGCVAINNPKSNLKYLHLPTPSLETIFF